MACNFKKLAKRVTNMVEIDGLKFYTFDNGEVAHQYRDRTLRGQEFVSIKCCNAKGRGLSISGGYAPIVAYQLRAIDRFNAA